MKECDRRYSFYFLVVVLLMVGTISVSCSSQKRKLLRRGKDPHSSEYVQLKVIQEKYDDLGKKYDKLKSELEFLKRSEKNFRPKEIKRSKTLKRGLFQFKMICKAFPRKISSIQLMRFLKEVFQENKGYSTERKSC